MVADILRSKQVFTLTGSRIKVLDSRDSNLKGVKGTVIDETKNMMLVKEGCRMLMIPKRVVKLSVQQRTGRLIVNGFQLIGKPEDRIKNYYWRD
ncbi:MAG: ribonuclease P protein subunit [Candidatus Odinarchaeota archaeon]